MTADAGLLRERFPTITFASPRDRQPVAPADGGVLAPDGPRALSRRAVFRLLGVAVLLANVLLALGVSFHWLTPLLGVVCVIAIPTFLLYGAGVVPAESRAERLGLSCVLTLLGAMLTGLAVNQVLPYVGVTNPLGEVSVILTTDVVLALLGAWCWPRHPSAYVVELPTLGPADRVVLIVGAVIPVLAVAGANRLNNGAGGGVTLVMLVLAGLQMVILLLQRDRLNEGVILSAIFGLSLSLLLMTSLRGWSTTGHDVQQEYLVFALTKSHGAWSMARFRDPYNASLSITILPTMIWQWARLDDAYVYKVIFQVLFAGCPVLVYLLARRVASITLSLLATIYFVSFVTFFQDMPMLNRQEIAFLFLTGILLVLFNDTVSLRVRRQWFCILGVGMVISHYSTTYVAIAVLGLTWVGGVVAKPLLDHGRWVGPARLERLRGLVEQPRKTRALTFGPLAFLILASMLWVGPLTRTDKGLRTTVTAALGALRGDNAGAKSSDTSYNLFSLARPSPAKRLAEYRNATIAATQDGRAGGKYFGEYFSDRVVSSYPTPVVTDANLPLTAVGRALAGIGLNVAAVNHFVRQASAKLLQLLIAGGLVAILFGKRREIAAKPEYVLLAIASMIIVLLQVVLPVLSVDYGLLRAFQQALLILDVVLVVGSLALVPLSFGRWRLGISSALALAFFASSTGILTQVVGGYGAQLHLNNAGTYYDIYYLHPQEASGIAWLKASTTAGDLGNIQSEIQTDRYTFTRVQTLTALNILNDVYPTLIRRDAYVFLGYSNVTKGESTVPYSGDLITYKYPLALLDNNKDLIYNNGGSRVYR